MFFLVTLLYGVFQYILENWMNFCLWNSLIPTPVICSNTGTLPSIAPAAFPSGQLGFQDDSRRIAAPQSTCCSGHIPPSLHLQMPLVSGHGSATGHGPQGAAGALMGKGEAWAAEREPATLGHDRLFISERKISILRKTLLKNLIFAQLNGAAS